MPIASHYTIQSFMDNAAITGGVTSYHPKDQQYTSDNASYTPDWSTTYNILTPKIYKTGFTPTDVTLDTNTTITWYDYTNPISPTLISTDTNYSVQNFANTTLSTAATQGTNNITVSSVPSGMIVGSVIKVGNDAELKVITVISSNTITLNKPLATGTYAIGATVANPNPKSLIIKKNILNPSNTTKQIVCFVSYYDTISKLTLTTKINNNFGLIRNGTGIVSAVMTTPNGTAFKTMLADSVTSLKLHCDLWRDKNSGTPDNTNIEYKWYIYDKTVFAPATLKNAASAGNTTITLNSVPADLLVGSALKVTGDSGEKTVTAINGLVVTFSPALGTGTYPVGTSVTNPYYQASIGARYKYLTSISGAGTNEIIVTPSDINGVGIFYCEIKDTDSASPTYNTYFYDTATIVDYTDPITITVTSSSGDIFKNGTGSTVLTARVFRGLEELDTGGTIYTYTWTKWNENNVQVNFVSDNKPTRTGKTLNVGSSDVGAGMSFKVTI